MAELAFVSGPADATCVRLTSHALQSTPPHPHGRQPCLGWIPLLSNSHSKTCSLEALKCPACASCWASNSGQRRRDQAGQGRNKERVPGTGMDRGRKRDSHLQSGERQRGGVTVSPRLATHADPSTPGSNQVPV